jgi:hypothetical protein
LLTQPDVFQEMVDITDIKREELGSPATLNPHH